VKGRVAVVTGATAGIGLAAAAALAARGATVVLVGRHRERGLAALAAVRAAGGRDAALHLADLSSLREVRRLAREILTGNGAVHVLVNNAAVITRRRETTVDGFERQFAVNHLAPFLLTRLLLDRLKASAPSRVVNVSSSAHFRGWIDFDDLQSERRYGHTRTYAMTKLANVLFTYELARRLGGTLVSANALHPGVVATALLADFVRLPRALRFVTRLVGLAPEEGARTVVHLAASRELDGVSGKYFVKERERRSSASSRDAALAARLWDESERLLRDAESDGA
jgi:NAD(P)-dependent dehydrogenase (short-subunit alcohol dehydrogenase family)